MKYRFICDRCDIGVDAFASITTGPPSDLLCASCGGTLRRIWDSPMFITQGVDPDFVPEHCRVTKSINRHIDKAAEARIEKGYAKDIQKKRSAVKSHGANKAMRLTHSVPTELYWGKIKETGDKNYWSDPKNRDKHKSCKVSS